MKIGKYFSMNSHYKNLFELKKKNAIVTGAVGILGQRFCRGLAEFGARVAVVDLELDRCAAFAAGAASADASGFVLRHVQAYDTADFVQHTDWFAAGYAAMRPPTSL